MAEEGKVLNIITMMLLFYLKKKQQKLYFIETMEQHLKTCSKKSAQLYEIGF